MDQQVTFPQLDERVQAFIQEQVEQGHHPVIAYDQTITISDHQHFRNVYVISGLTLYSFTQTRYKDECLHVRMETVRSHPAEILINFLNNRKGVEGS